ncbi:iron chelate uptake ABC transporter family permease subunit [Acrocarpospora macrocephala]|uniref:ABC transporter permease n=1 Tax=Acrocarpospora macrocephala TaxID=150177 RepID=A0A5M3WS76_9ACTN|nr:iron ABC transporter permease [Acrocarpospora macrocephala]GES12237.1 ABC transporter permease [Acrocarpospora macrocephala]
MSSPHLISERRYPLLVVLLLAAVPVLLVAAVTYGAVDLPAADVWRVITAHLTTGRPPADVSGIDNEIIWNSRAPRTVLALIAGAGLAVAGAILQTVVRNPLADPYVLGVTSGASLAAVAVITLGSVAGLGVSGAAFVGACATLALVLALGSRRGALTPTRLVLAGVALSYLLQGATSYLQLRAQPDQLAGILFWLLGSVAGARWSDLTAPGVIVVACTGWLLLQGRRLNALLLGDETAAALGVHVHRFRLALLAVAALVTAAVIAVAGGIAFVGLIVPHAVRLLVGPDHRRTLPLIAVTGGLFLVAADLAARTLSPPLELPLGILTAILGTPFFLWLLRRESAVA